MAKLFNKLFRKQPASLSQVSPATPSQAPLATPGKPRTRTFFVLLDDTDDDPPEELLKTPEQICQEVLADTMVEFFGQDPELTPPSSPTEGVLPSEFTRESPPAAAEQPPATSPAPPPELETPAPPPVPAQPDVIPPPYPLDADPEPESGQDSARSKRPVVPARKRKRPTETKAKAPPEPKPPAVVKRPRIRRNLKLPNDQSSKSSGS